MTQQKRNGHNDTVLESIKLEGRTIDLELDVIWEALERGGFGRSEIFEKRVEELLPLGKHLNRAQAIGRIFAKDAIAAGDIGALPEPICGADFFFFGICTAGHKIDERARALREAGELVDSMILDAIAMTGLSLIGDQLGRVAFDWARERNLSASRAFSPGAGAGGWELKHQRLLFDHLPEEPLGVRLTPQFLMQPLKSISFVIGIGKEVRQAKHAFSCAGCGRLDCAYRHIPEDEMVHEQAT